MLADGDLAEVVDAPELANETSGAPKRTGSSKRWRIGGLAALFSGLTWWMLRPKLGKPLTSFMVFADSDMITWTLLWEKHVLLTNPLGFFNGPIFWPQHWTITYSEPFIGLVLPFAFLESITGHWQFAMTGIVVGGVILNLAATYSLVKWLTGRVDAALVSAVAFSFSSFTFAHLVHVQFSVLGLVPLGFLLLFKLFDKPTWPNTVWLSLTSIALIVTCLYLGVLYLLLVGLMIVAYLITTRFSIGKARTVHLITFVGATLLGSSPVLVVYGFAGNPSRAVFPEWNFVLADFAHPYKVWSFYIGLIKPSSSSVENMFFIGVVAMALAFVGAIVLMVRFVRRRATTSGDSYGKTLESSRQPVLRAPYFGFLMMAGAVSLILAFGDFGALSPFGILHKHVPGFGGIRVPARFAIVSLLSLATLSGVGYSFCVRRSLRLPTRAIICGLVIAAICVELGGFSGWPGWSSATQESRANTKVYERISMLPAGAVLELPTSEGPISVAVDARRMRMATADWHPRVNGYSGYFPKRYFEFMATLNQFPSEAALDLARELRIRYVIVHTEKLDSIEQLLGEQRVYKPEEIAAIVRNLPPQATVEHVGNSYLIDLHPVVAK